ncbi:hypothetical protein H5187_09000 [Pseudoalteromonas sp. SG44-1]|uniref:hypothetical protein n=1 Tax=Pseudoalteromonas sp. SG44-1 TaxID=2760964 RepID=UPI001600ABFE|nr:hypothetical protein [Pseudoalteromonas sp. SG44-1]MBB1417413.1 hypothetical protein [Pseudoalteromonas sp. SG44-1]
MKIDLKKMLEGKTVTTIVRGDYVFKTVEHDGKEIVVGVRLVITNSSRRIENSELVTK